MIRRFVLFVSMVCTIVACSGGTGALQEAQPWLKAGSLYTYQGNEIISQNMGGTEAFDQQLETLHNDFLALVTEQPALPFKNVYLAVVFNSQGQMRYWAYGDDDVNNGVLDKAAATALSKGHWATQEGVVGFAFQFRATTENEGYIAKRPVPRAWRQVTEGTGKSITASELFEAVLAAE